METIVKWNGVKIHFGEPTGYTRFRQMYYDQISHEEPVVSVRLYKLMMSNYASAITSVDGDIGFEFDPQVPTSESFAKFCEWVGSEKPQLMELIDKAYEEARSGTNDPDLLPPEELDEKKDENQE